MKTGYIITIFGFYISEIGYAVFREEALVFETREEAFKYASKLKISAKAKIVEY